MLSLEQNFPFVCIILSMATGILCAALKPKKAMVVCIANLVINFILSLLALRYCIKVGDFTVFWMGHFPAPFGNEIRFGILETLLATGFSLVMLLSILGGLKHVFHDVDESKQNYYFLMQNLLFASILALIYTNDLFTAYVFVEINTLTSCSIVMLKKGRETLVATTRYLIMSLLGSGLFLIGLLDNFKA